MSRKRWARKRTEALRGVARQGSLSAVGIGDMRFLCLRDMQACIQAANMLLVSEHGSIITYARSLFKHHRRRLTGLTKEYLGRFAQLVLD